MKYLDLPDDAESVGVEVQPDGVYLDVDVLDDADDLVEGHTYALGPEADR